MPSFLDAHGIANAINQIIAKAEKSIILISAYISFPPMLFQGLQFADSRGIGMAIVFGVSQNLPFKHYPINIRLVTFSYKLSI